MEKLLQEEKQMTDTSLDFHSNLYIRDVLGSAGVFCS